MVQFIFIILVLFSGVAEAAEQEIVKTLVYSQKEAGRLLGAHLFTTQTVSKFYLYFGDARIENKNGVYYVQGSHERMDKSDSYEHSSYVRMKGRVVEISDLSFVLQGTIEISDFGFIDKPCAKTGVFNFSRREHPKYWRYKMRCDESGIEYVDLFYKEEQ